MENIIFVNDELNLELGELEIAQVQVVDGVIPVEQNLKIQFYYPKWKSIKAATQKYSEGIVLACLNSDIRCRIKEQVRNNLPWGLTKLETKNNMLKLFNEKQTLQFKQDDALNYIPGLKANSDPHSLIKRAKELSAKGLHDEAKSCRETASVMLKTAQEQLNKLFTAIENEEL